MANLCACTSLELLSGGQQDVAALEQTDLSAMDSLCPVHAEDLHAQAGVV